MRDKLQESRREGKVTGEEHGGPLTALVMLFVLKLGGGYPDVHRIIFL